MAHPLISQLVDHFQGPLQFILSKKLLEALELPEDAEISDLLSEATYLTGMPAYAHDERGAWHFISERGLYALIFISESPAFQRFRN